MSHRQFSKWYAGVLSVGAASLALSAHAQMDTFGGDPSTNALVRIPRDTDDWTRHFRLGAMAGFGIKARFGISSGSFGVSGNNPAAGIYDNGYVHQDNSGDTTLTSDWGYNTSGQIVTKSGVQYLELTSTSAFSTSGESSSTDGGVSPGVDLAYGGNLWYWRHARVGWELGLDWLPVDIKQNSTQAGTVTQETYDFNANGITAPNAPYQGTSSGVGPLISTTGNQIGGASYSEGTISGTHEMDVSLFTLRLGPSMYWDLSQRFSLSVGAGPAIGVMEGDYKYNEVITDINSGYTAVNSGKISGADVVFGGYVTAALMYHVEKNGDIYLGAQYMPMTDGSLSGSGRRGELDLQGQVYLSLGINWPF